MAFRTRASIDANQHKGIVVQNADGSGGLVVPTGRSLTNSIPIDVSIVDGSGNQIASFGGGTQYSELTTTSPGTGTLSLGRYKSAAPTLTDGQMYGLQLDNSGNLKVTGSLSVGGTTDNSTYTAGSSTGTPSYGFYHSVIDTVTDGRTAAIGMTNKRAMFVNLQNSGGTEIGTSGAPVRIDPTGTTAQPVTNTGTFAVQATLSAETTKVIGTVRTADGSGNLLTSTSNALDVNIKSGSSSGQQYADGAARGTATGTLMMVDDGTNIQSAIGTTAGVLKVDISATTANATAIKVDGSAVIQPVSLTSTTVTGTVAVTQSTSPWIVSGSGTAGSAASGVVSIQGIASMTPVQVSQATAANLNATIVGTGTLAVQAAQSGTYNITNISGTVSLPTGAATEATLAKLTQTQGSATSGQSGPLIQGAVTTAAPTYVTTQTSPLSLDTAGNLRTTTVLGAGSAVIGHVITDSGSTTAVTGNVTVTQATGTNLHTVIDSGTITAVTAITNALPAGSNLLGKVGIDQTTPGTTNAVSIAQIGANTVLTGNGVTGTGSQRVTIASDNTAFSVNAIQSTAASLTAGWVVINGEQSDTTGTFTNATQTTSVTATNLAGYGNVLVSINGTYNTATAVFEGSDDGGTTFYPISEAARTDSNTIESGYTTLTNVTRAWQINNPGWDSLRVRSTAVATGTVNVRISPSAAPSAAGATVAIGLALPTGSNTIGAVTGTKTNNNAAPGVLNVGTLPGVATNVAPTYVEGNQVALSTDLTGALRISGGGGGTQYAELNTTSPATATAILGRYQTSAPTLTNGQMFMPQLDASGNLKVTGSLSIGGTTDGAVFTALSSTFTGVGAVFNDNLSLLTPGTQAALRLTADRRLKVDTGSVTGGMNQSNVQQIAGIDVATTADGTQLVSIAGPTGDAIDTVGSSLSVYVANSTILNVAQSGTWRVGSSTSTGAALPTTAFLQGVSDGTNLVATKTVGNSKDTTGAGVQAAGILGFDGLNYRAIRTDTLGNIIPSSSLVQPNNLQQIDGNDIATVAPGVQLTALAGPTGDPVDTFGNSLSVVVARPVPASDETSTVFNGTQGLTPQFAAIIVAASGVNVVIAAIPGKIIRVLSYVLTSNGIVNVKWQSHAAPTDLTGLDYLVANTGVSSGYSPVGHFQTRVGESLDINLSGATAVGGHMTYLVI